MVSPRQPHESAKRAPESGSGLSERQPYEVFTNREEVKREPLTPPKVERATEMGMIHAITPSSFSPNVWGGGMGGRTLDVGE